MVKFIINNGVLNDVLYLGNETVLTIPSDVKTIKKCKIDLDTKEIVIPSSVEKIEIGAFLHGSKLNKITIINNPNFIVKNKLLLDKEQTIVFLAERDISGNVELPNTVKTINDHAFNNCIRITSIKMSEGVNYIGAFAFIGCTKLSKISLPSINSYELKESTFENCWSLRRITIPHNIVGLGPCLFYDCHNLKEIKIESNHIKTIPAKCFMLCDRLDSLYFYEGVESIDDAAFLGCRLLMEITLPSTVKYLGLEIFRDDENLTVITSSKPLIDYCEYHGVSWELE